MPSYIEIPDILFKGAKVYYLDDATTSVPPSTPPTPSAPTPTLRVSYPVSKLTWDDKYYLYRMVMPYKSALKSLPGTPQIHFDLLTDDMQRYYSDAVPQPPGTTSSLILKTLINQAINYAGSDHAAEVASWNIASYKGPLVEIVQNLINKKLGRI